MHSNSLFLHWPINRGCYKCGTRMLSTEMNNALWRCFNGKFTSLRLRLYPPNIDTLLSDGKVSDTSCKLNNLFCFSVMGIHGSFRQLPTPSYDVLCRRTYRRMLDIERGQHPLRWFLYFYEDRHHMGVDIQVDSPIVQQIEHNMLQSHPYMEQFRFLCDQPPGVPYALELKNQP